MSAEQTAPGKHLFNKKVSLEGVKLLAALYRIDALKVARLCDEHLDRSGALLGDVRTFAREGA